MNTNSSLTETKSENTVLRCEATPAVIVGKWTIDARKGGRYLLRLEGALVAEVTFLTSALRQAPQFAAEIVDGLNGIDIANRNP